MLENPGREGGREWDRENLENINNSSEEELVSESLHVDVDK